jgi:hypothetical protein
MIDGRINTTYTRNLARKMNRRVFVLFMLFLGTPSGATEIEGRITDAAGRGATGARIVIVCGSQEFVKTLDSDARFRFSNVPDNKPCTMTISYSGATTATPLSFRSTPGKLTLNRQVRKYGERLVVY